MVIIGLLYQWQSLLIHSNVNLRTGWLKWLVATPEFHHWHHSREEAGYNKNFSGQLPLWDIVFGTAYLPSVMPTSYGINEPMSRNYVMQLLGPLPASGAAAAPPLGGTRHARIPVRSLKSFSLDLPPRPGDNRLALKACPSLVSDCRRYASALLYKSWPRLRSHRNCRRIENGPGYEGTCLRSGI